MKNTQSNFLSIDWKEAKAMVESGRLTAIGSNLGQIHNQGQYTMSKDGNRLYKLRTGVHTVIYDLIATTSTYLSRVKFEIYYLGVMHNVVYWVNPNPYELMVEVYRALDDENARFERLSGVEHAKGAPTLEAAVELIHFFSNQK